ncbi:MAG: hypothetical protein O7G87_05595 [bacterium]|nr:hypothetical protein [bacterium]
MNVRILLFLFLLLTGCGTQNRGLPRVGVRGQPWYDAKLYVQVQISERANQNHPIALDLLVVYDNEVLAMVMAMTGKDWFARREQVKRDNRGKLDVWSWEWVPGQVVSLQAVPLSARSGTGFIFADYLGTGDHRYKIDPYKNITIRLLEKEVVVGRLR